MKKFLQQLNYINGATFSFTQSLKLLLLEKLPLKIVNIKRQGRKIALRNNGTDKIVFLSTFKEGFHRSPFELRNNATIIDLGSNIGLTLIDFRDKYPNSRIIGVEMDPNNFKLLEKNVVDLENCEVVNAAIWKVDREVWYECLDAQSFKIVDREGANTKKMSSLSMHSLFTQLKVSKADYVKMDIEGAEFEVLSLNGNNEWLRKVKILGLEYHPENDQANQATYLYFKDILEKYNFKVLKASCHWSSLIAINLSYDAN